MTYKFVTREDIEKVQKRNPDPDWISLVSFLFAERESETKRANRLEAVIDNHLCPDEIKRWSEKKK